MCTAYATDHMLAFLLHDIALARSIMSCITLAEERRLPPEAMVDNKQYSSAYWLHEQDYCCDVIRQMELLADDSEAFDGKLFHYCHPPNGQRRMLRHPNVFLTIAPGEWTFPLNSMFCAWKSNMNHKNPGELSHMTGLLALHIYHVLKAMMTELLGAGGKDFFECVFHYLLRVEFQGRGTLHIHVAFWALLYDEVDLRGVSGESHNSPLIRWLEARGFASVDVQYGDGFMNYINGYTTKAHDSLSFTFKEHIAPGADYKWRMTWRLLCKVSPCIPEIFIQFASLPLMLRSFSVVVLYAPIQRDDLDFDQNESLKLYAAYLRHFGGLTGSMANVRGLTQRVSMSFYTFAHTYRLTNHHSNGGLTRWKLPPRGMISVGIRFSFEMLDIYLCQMCTMFFPHRRSDDFLSPSRQRQLVMPYTRHISGAMDYLRDLCWHCRENGDLFIRRSFQNGDVYAKAAFPRDLTLFSGEFVAGAPVFPTRLRAFQYFSTVILSDLDCRARCGRRLSLAHHLHALFLLDGYVSADGDEIEAARRRSQWDAAAAPLLAPPHWSQEQVEALQLIEQGLSVCDANCRQDDRMLSLSGVPGSGKSEVLVHSAIRAVAQHMRVLILCPTGALVHRYRERFPESDKIVVETIHSSFQIFREQDEVVQYSPPTRLRQFDLILLDEASQVEDHIARKLMLGLAELPQKPFVVFTADFQQLNPVQGGGLMRRICDDLPQKVLTQIFRTNDDVLRNFCSIVRLQQPAKDEVVSFFGDRTFYCSLVQAVRHGIELHRSSGKMFTWLTVTNKGAEKVNRAALEILGYSQDLDRGLCGDPKVAGMPIVLKLGVLLRLTRNLDKPRGFVNGALGTVEVVLGPYCAILRLTNGTLVLLHPVANDSAVPFLPCTYGYATTIRRAQGASLYHGCLYFDHCYPPERGYAYVGVSRFRSARGVYHFGRIRKSDWLPVGPFVKGQQEKRGDESQQSNSDDEAEYVSELSMDEKDLAEQFDMVGSDAGTWSPSESDLTDLDIEEDESSMDESGAPSPLALFDGYDSGSASPDRVASVVDLMAEYVGSS